VDITKRGGAGWDYLYFNLSPAVPDLKGRRRKGNFLPPRERGKKKKKEKSKEVEAPFPDLLQDCFVERREEEGGSLC